METEQSDLQELFERKEMRAKMKDLTERLKDAEEIIDRIANLKGVSAIQLKKAVKQYREKYRIEN